MITSIGAVSASDAAVLLLPLTFAALVAGSLAPLLHRWVGAGPPAALGALLLTGALYWLSRVTEHAAKDPVAVWPLLVARAGGGLAMAVLAVAALTDVPFLRLGLGAAALGSAQWIGVYSLAPAVGSSVMQSVVALRLSQASRTAEDASARIDDALAEGITRALTVGCLFTLVCVPVAVIAFGRPAIRHRSRPTGGSTVAS